MKKTGASKVSQFSAGRALVNKVEKRRQRLKNENDSEPLPVKDQQSVTDRSTLEEFLATAQLAGTEFAAERANVQMLKQVDNKVYGVARTTPTVQASADLQDKFGHLLQIPRRPKWHSHMSADELTQRENAAYLQWRQQIAMIEETEELILTPYERNLELWRQLWRVIERSDVVLQIVDARNPLLFWSRDLEKYLGEFDTQKTSLMLANKADLLTANQRKIWSDYFKKEDINCFFFCATESEKAEQGKVDSERQQVELSSEKILDGAELIDLLKSLQPDILKAPVHEKRQLVVGMVGYPNVGKSSTINRLLGEKKLPVSATPGKTRHFQTLRLDHEMTLCDCPGLVMPSFALSRQEMLLNGVLPVSQMREFRPPIELLCSRIPKAVFRKTYGIALPVSGEEVYATCDEVLTSLAFSRGFMSAKGIPDASRAARMLIQDVIVGKIRWSAPPPGWELHSELEPYYDKLETSAEIKESSVQLDIIRNRKLLAAKPKPEEIDDEFFGPPLSNLHIRSAKVLKAGDSKKHPEKRNRKEKSRRVFKHLDA